MIGEIQAKVAAVARLEQVPRPHVPLVCGVTHQDLQIPAKLSGQKAYPIGNSRRYSYHIVKINVSFQQAVRDAAGVNGAQCAPFQDQPGFHLYHLF